MKELQLEEYMEKFEDFKGIYHHFKKTKKRYEEEKLPIYEKISDDVFASFKEHLESDNPKQKLVYDMKEFKVKL